MNIKELIYFKAVYEEKSINKASKKVFMSSQGLSRVISNLERELGTILFERTAKGVESTESARILYENAYHLIEEFTKVENAIRLLEAKENMIRISFARGVLNALSFRVVSDFINKFPELKVSWEEQANELVREQVLTYQTDVGMVVGKSSSKEIIEKLVAKKYVILLVYEGHPFYSREVVGIEELEGEDILILNEQYQIYHEFHKVCLSKKFKPKVAAKTSDSQFLIRLCKQKNGLGVLLDFSINDFNLEGIKVVPLKEKITWDIYHICHKKNIGYTNIKKFQNYIDQL